MIKLNCNKTEILKLQEIIEGKLSPLIDNDFVLLDIPNHRNVGDSLIWKGELEYFKRLKYSCLKQFNRYTFNESSIQSSNTVILLHGGGNFGDIYSSSQSFKKKVVENFPDNKIIIMPQTIFYENEKNKVNDFAIFNKHKNLYICVRDKISYDIISQMFDNDRILLLPDMAFFINLDEFIVNEKSNKSLFLNRTDGEKVDNKYSDVFIDKEVDVLDWPTYNSSNKRLNVLSNYVEALDGKICNILKYIPIVNLCIHPSYGFKNRRGMDKHVETGINFINKYDIIYTTRLHGMILSVLLNKEVIILDNSYGKNRGFYDAWLKNFNNLKLL
ncbi:polysaccharide pyruvyl transferase family protein [Flavobacterium agrisoli]|uniref:Polysaccharide pyruvyl transferase family protein n=1 Tax=Flavobacterium agrisoli TaxID=2793066 RepID=A0A934PQ50_9FLAO|nr:polysaccharide pyruvyl transferase family protein [Flavobacterium agrisoli]MBK0371290.1 polysaccharide pyruvyl transferase family protein [Flavobacterium agrisoli]